MKKTILIIILIVSISTSLLFAMGNRENTKIGLLISDSNNKFDKDFSNYLSELSASNNVKLNIKDGQSNSLKQIEQLEVLLDEEYRNFIIIAQDKSFTEEMSQLINILGGSVVFVNTNPSVEALKIGKEFYFVGSSNLAKGQIVKDEANTSLMLILETLKNGGGLEGRTINNIPSLKKTINKEPCNDISVIKQCYLVDLK